MKHRKKANPVFLINLRTGNYTPPKYFESRDAGVQELNNSHLVINYGWKVSKRKF